MVEKENKIKDMKWEKVQLNENQLKSFKLELDKSELAKDSNNLTQYEFEEKIKTELPKRQAEQILKDMEEIISKGVDKEGKPIEPLDLEYHKLVIEKQRNFIKLDMPMRNIKLQYRQFMNDRSKINSPENQISKLKKAIQTGFTEQLVPDVKNSYTG